jgi:hypothetical protein
MSKVFVSAIQTSRGHLSRRAHPCRGISLAKMLMIYRCRRHEQARQSGPTG